MIARNIYLKASAIVVLLAVCAAGARAVGDAAPPSATATDANTAAPTGLDANAVGTDSIWHDLSTEELEKLIARAEQTRLAEERQKVVAELRDDLLYDDDAVDKAVAMLKKASKPTQADNIKHICEAFAIVDRGFAKPYKLYRDGKYDAAALAARRIIDPKKTSNLSAAVHFIYADALGEYADSLDKDKGKDPAKRKRVVGLHHDAVEACRDLLVRMPERTSFAVTAGLQAAATYERMHRYYYAMQMYLFCLTNYGLTIDPDEFERIRLKIEKWQQMYKQPLTTIAARMGDVEKRLAASDGGKGTQAKGAEVVLLLEDLIKTMEEKSGGSKAQAKGGKKGKRPGSKSGKDKGKGKGKGKGQSPPSSVNQPSSPAQASALVPGAVARPTKRSDVRPTAETGEWAKKSPRRRQQIQQLMKRGMSERSRDQIRDYLAAIAESSTE